MSLVPLITFHKFVMGGTSGVYMSDTLIDNNDAIEKAERNKAFLKAEQEYLTERNKEVNARKAILRQELRKAGNAYRENKHIKNLMHIRKVAVDLSMITKYS